MMNTASSPYPAMFALTIKINTMESLLLIKIRFDAAQLKLDYEHGPLFGHAEYRCYQYDRLCDFSTLVDGYVGYKLNKTDQVVAGVQPIPFGPGRFGVIAYMEV